jgi:thiamine-phosphate pyrophosphorylase
MHKDLPNFFIFTDEYNNEIFRNKNRNIGVIYRNYKARNRAEELLKIVKACKKCRYQLFISNDIKLAYRFKADGIYLPSFNNTNKFLNLEKKNIKIIGSAHSQREINEKIGQKCIAIFLSPLFFVNKSKKNLGLYKFNYLAYLNKINFFALGGISKKNIKILKLLQIKGFGGIQIFKKKPACKRPVFLKNNFF